MERVKASQAFKFFAELVDTLFARPEAEGFRKPVLDLWTEDAVPGYLETIENPMDLGTIKTRLKEGEYNRYHPEKPYLDEDAVMNDIVLTFKNCMTYNEPNSDFHQKAQDLLRIARKEFKPRIEERKKEEQLVEQRRRERRSEMEKARRARIRKQKEEEAKKREAKRMRDAERRAARKRAEEEARKAEEERERLLREKREKERLIRAERKRIAEAEALAAEQERLAKKAAVEEDIGMSRKRSRQSGDTNGFQNGELLRPKKIRKPLDERSTSSLSSDEAAELEDELDLVNGEDVRELAITFVSTKGMEKKRGRKSATVQQLEVRHEELMRRRRIIVETKERLDRLRHMQMTMEEKVKLCEKMSTLDAVQMREVCQIIAVGTNQPQLLSEVEVDVDVENMDNRILREIQVFLENPVVAKCQSNLRAIETELADIEQEYVGIRYQTPGRR